MPQIKRGSADTNYSLDSTNPKAVIAWLQHKSSHDIRAPPLRNPIRVQLTNLHLEDSDRVLCGENKAVQPVDDLFRQGLDSTIPAAIDGLTSDPYDGP